MSIENQPSFNLFEISFSSCSGCTGSNRTFLRLISDINALKINRHSILKVFFTKFPETWKLFPSLFWCLFSIRWNLGMVEGIKVLGVLMEGIGNVENHVNVDIAFASFTTSSNHAQLLFSNRKDAFVITFVGMQG